MANDATRAQNRAADPATSTWLEANAGSGKTRVLTDRVARLLLDGIHPERILCLTYTKAAAMEMQNRLFQNLGKWSMKSDDALRETLMETGVDAAGLDAGLLARARTLFARAIEAPGGLKIQTIHSFCGSVLRRFPLEAQVSPAFTEIDERVQTRLLDDLLDTLTQDAAGRAALDLVAPYVSLDDGLAKLAKAVVYKADAFAAPADWETICGFCGIPSDLTEAGLVAETILSGDGAMARRVAPHFDPQSRSTSTLRRVFDNLNWVSPGLSDLAQLETALLTGEGAKDPFAPKVDRVGNAKIRAQLGADMAPLNALMIRVGEARPHRQGLLSAKRVHALHRFAACLLPAYAHAKQVRGWLDFDDLIARMNRLLSDPKVAQWVLFRLDGGIDHILVDEAQDTSPRQWRIIDRLAEEFGAGQGARADIERTIFVVGDKKQSIYSFQGADPAEFDRMRAHFAERLAQSSAPFQPAQLLHSFRSAPPILELVDRVAARLGAPGLGGDTQHHAFFSAMPGRVDLWPAIEATPRGDPPNWEDPQDLVSEDHHRAILAKTIAEQIAAMLSAPPQIGDRPLNAGDILILVRSRAPLFRKIIAELKAKGLPVAGVDRSQLTAPLAVKDLSALCRFLATPEDDLSLAEALRSPLLGLSEADLYDLAHGRDGYLWSALRDCSDRYAQAHGILTDLRDQADYLRPYDLLERMLVRHGGRARMIAQLGAEAEDAIDALLAQALAYEAMEVPSLTGFVSWLEAGDVEVKRDLNQADGQIRIMTVHGAKGLEAPVVILPDCAQRNTGGNRIELLSPEDGPLIWPPKTDDMPPAVRAAAEARKAREAEEANRLLYVAMTRAERWLIVAASGALGKDPDASWYNIVSDALSDLPAQPLDVPGLEGSGQRLEVGDWTSVAPAPPDSAKPAALPDWAQRPAPRPDKDAPARSPSDLGGAKALPGAGDESATALRRGRIMHLLLEHLAPLPQPAWAAAAPGIAALDGPGPAIDLAPLLSQASTVLSNPDLEAVFAPDTLAEVELVGHSPTLDAEMTGQIDRLIVTDDSVLAVDFKTNLQVPGTAQDVPEGLLRQMGAYAELLAQIYPQHRIDTAILWSETGTLMHLPHDLVSCALQRARGA